MTDKNPGEFRVQNRVRQAVFVLIFAAAFMIAVWLLPPPYSFIAIAALIVVAAVSITHHQAHEALCSQIFDRIEIKRFGVEYCGGTFSENWQRPFNEFRVELKSYRLIFFNLHRVRLKHRVLSDVVVSSTWSQSKAKHTLDQLIKNSPLKQLKTDE